MKGYQISAKNKVAEILIYEEIGEGWYGGITAKQFAKDLAGLGEVDALNIRINSPGGNVFDGNAIYNLLKSHKARKVVHIDGLAASIASVIAMAGDEIHMAANALLMIHNAWGMVIGYASEMRETADLLDKITASIRTTYVARTGMGDAEIKDLMDAETWMSADESREYGFIDDITDELEMAAHFDLSKFKYRNAPPKHGAKRQANDLRFRLARMNLETRRIASNPKR